jgi:TnpA family transposase
VFHGFGGTVKQKGPEKQDEIFWFLTVVQNTIVLWNALALEQAIQKSKIRDSK